MKNTRKVQWACFATAGQILATLSISSAHEEVVIILMSSTTGEKISTVTSAGQVWMDRNPGALRPATKSADPEAYGSLYQWGRGGDGHEHRSSQVTATNSSDDYPNLGSFIVEPQNPWDWKTSQNDDLWQDVSSIHNPCPSGFRIPTLAEWQTEISSWPSKNAAGAMSSPLKLPTAGRRSESNALVSFTGTSGFYWTSNAVGNLSYIIIFGDDFSVSFDEPRAEGASIRCIKE